MVGGDRWRACKSGEATQDERGAEANSLSISSFYPTQESFVAQADASIFFLFHATPNPASQAFIFKECPKTVVLAVVRAMHQ